ncbi:MAG: class I SAM-dependent methyltransferase [Promethearchaeota archaeon]
MRDVKSFYNRLARIYDPLISGVFTIVAFNEKEYRSKMIHKIAGINCNTVIIDLGCGTGRNFSLIRSLIGNNKIFGVDISNKMIEIAQKKVEHEGLENIFFIENDIANWKEILSEVGDDFVALSSFTLSVIWANKNAVEGFLKICAQAKYFSIMDGNWRIGSVPLKGYLTKTLSILFGINNDYWRRTTEDHISKFIKLVPNIMFGDMLFIS